MQTSAATSEWRSVGRVSGFSLTELMITVAIVAILASVAYPAYTNQVRRSNRTDATTALLKVAVAQEKYYLTNNTYATDFASLNINGTERGYYTLSYPTTPNAAGFTAQATAVGAQFKDTTCRTLTIDQAGQRGAKNASSGDTKDTCWK